MALPVGWMRISALSNIFNPRMSKCFDGPAPTISRSEEHTSELQSLRHLVCRLLLEKKKIAEDFDIDPLGAGIDHVIFDPEETGDVAAAQRCTGRTEQPSGTTAGRDHIILLPSDAAA